MADFIGETNFLEGKVEAINDIVKLGVGNSHVIGRSDLSLSVGQTAYLAIRPEKINIRPHNAEPATHEDTETIFVDGEVMESIYIGTDTRYRVQLLGDQQLFVRTQNFGARYDTTFSVGDAVQLHWPAENARILTE